MKATGFFHEKLVVNLFGFYKNFIYKKIIYEKYFGKLNVCVNKTQRVFDWGLGWEKLGSSLDPVYYISILFQLQIILQFCETRCSILFLIKNNRENQYEGK